MPLDQYKIPYPDEEAEELVPNVLLVPFLAIDKQRYRLGQGGGYYDRTIAWLKKEKNVLTIGVGYKEQEVEEVPREQHDSALDAVVLI